MIINIIAIIIIILCHDYWLVMDYYWLLIII